MLTLIGLLAGCGAKTKPAVTEAAQMNDAAFTIGVPSGATAVNAVESALPQAKMQYYNSLSDAYLAVQQGKVDAFAFDRNLLGFAIANGLDGVQVLPGDVGASDEVAIGISGNSDIVDLQQKINDALSQLDADGTLDEMFTRWVVDADDTMPEIPKPEHPALTLTVGTSGEVQPFSYFKGNALTGYDLELAARLALYLNAALEVKLYSYDGFAAALESGTIDCVLANLNATAERRETMDFSTPLYHTQTALLVRADGAATDNQTQSAQSNAPRVPVETARVGVMDGSTNAVYAAEHYPNANIMSFKNYVDSTAALDAGKLDYAMMDYTSALRFIRSNRNLRIASDALTDEKLCLGISKSQPALAQAVSAVVDQYLADGTMDEIIAHWMKPDGSEYDDVATPKLDGAPKLKVAIISSREPTTFLQNGAYAGMDVELIDRVLYDLGYQAEYIDMDLAAVIASLESGKADLSLGMYSTPERLEKVFLTAPYFENPQVLLAKDTGAADASHSALETAHYGVMTGSTGESYLLETYPNAAISTFPSNADSFAALAANKVDYVVTAYTICQNAVQTNSALAIYQEGLRDQQVAMAVSKDNPQLLEKLNAVLRQYQSDGILDEISQRWLNADGNYAPVDIPVAEGKNGTLKVAMTGNQEPFGFMLDGKYQGADCELIERIAYDLDMKVDYQTMQFAGLIAALSSGKADVICSAMAVTQERAQSVDFTIPYFNNPLSIACRAEDVGTNSHQTLGFWDGLKASFIRTFVTESRWKLVLDGLRVTVLISICAGLLGTILGFGICMLRRSKKRLASVFAAVLIRVIQGTPIVVLLMILYYIIFGKVDISAILVAIIGFAVNFGVYVSEMMRTGIDAVDVGQIEAARALGFTKMRAFWKITFPQAARHFLPVFKGEFISMVKMTSVVGYIAIQDLTKVSDIIRSRTLEAFFPLIATAVIYFLVANVLTMLLSRLEIRLDPKRRKRTVKAVVMK
ncbi:MAG: ABC transporter permease subunit [Oscillospiraceae bacterium]|nr:ABC transporter permease subunit [Oscillospiraceae bacterium]